MIHIYPETRGLIFDCDGTLVDTMPIHMEAWEKAFEDYGEICSDEFLDPLKGMLEEEIVDLYNQRFGQTIDSGELVARKHAYFRENIDTVMPVKPVVELVRRCHKKYPMAVVSGGKQENVHRVLEIVHIKHLFEIILTANDHIKPKPAPDIFLEAARCMGIEPCCCQVFEDGDIGLNAARRVGMAVTDVREYV